MKKSKNRVIEVIVILLMLCTSPLSVTYSFADIGENQEENKRQNESKAGKSIQKEGLETILTEKVVNGKLELRHYTLPDNTIEEDFQRILSFEDEITSWVYVNYEAYHSGIVLFHGKASKIGENFGGISINNRLNSDESKFSLELSEKLNDSHVVMNEITSENNLNYRIIFSGKIVEIDEENLFSIFFINSNLKNSEMDQNIKFSQIDDLGINSEKSVGSNQEFRNSISGR